MLKKISVRPVYCSEESLFQDKMQAHHYLGALPEIGNTIWYVAAYQTEWQALLVFSAAALKCGVSDHWIGWNYRHQYERLNLIANNSRFLILPDRHQKNPGSKISSLCRRRIQQDWIEHVGFETLKQLKMERKSLLAF